MLHLTNSHSLYLILCNLMFYFTHDSLNGISLSAHIFYLFTHLCNLKFLLLCIFLMFYFTLLILFNYISAIIFQICTLRMFVMFEDCFFI